MTLIGSPVSLASCSLMWRVGLGVCEKAFLRISNCFALMVVRGPRRLEPAPPSSGDFDSDGLSLRLSPSPSPSTEPFERNRNRKVTIDHYIMNIIDRQYRFDLNDTAQFRVEHGLRCVTEPFQYWLVPSRMEFGTWFNNESNSRSNYWRETASFFCLKHVFVCLTVMRLCALWLGSIQLGTGPNRIKKKTGLDLNQRWWGLPSESLGSLSSMVVDGVEGRCDLISRRGGARPVMGVDGRGDASVSPLVLSAAVLLLLASFSMDSDMRFSSSSSSDAEFNSNSIDINRAALHLAIDRAVGLTLHHHQPSGHEQTSQQANKQRLIARVGVSVPWIGGGVNQVLLNQVLLMILDGIA